MGIILIVKGEGEGRSAKSGAGTLRYASEPPHYQRCLCLLHIPGAHQYGIQHRNSVDGLAAEFLSDQQI